MQVLIKFSNALIHFNAQGFALTPVVHHHRHECFPIPPTAWTSVLDTFDSIASESEIMNARWASLMGICQEILGVTIKDWIGPFCAGENSGLLFPSGILTSISVDAV